MAGSQDSENPVGVNVVPLVDIIFCLCVFFMCSFKFRQLESRIETWLPKTEGAPTEPGSPVPLPSEIRVALLWDDASRTVTRKFGLRTIADDAELERTIAAARDAWTQSGHPEAPLTIDGDTRVPWSEIVNVVDIAKRGRVEKIEFAMGAAPSRRTR